MRTRLPLFWRVFAVNAALLTLATLLLLLAPVTVSVPVRLAEALILVVGLAVALAANVALLRGAFLPLERLVRRMETVDLLRPGERLPVATNDEVGRVGIGPTHPTPVIGLTSPTSPAGAAICGRST